MKRRGLIFNSRPDKAAMFALGLMLGLCPVSQAWADTNITDSQVVAQAQKKVKGQVIDATGEPLIGVNISVIGGTEGTITDIDGNYAINVPAGAKLKFSYIGYKDQIIDVAAQTVINVKLQEDSEVLDEVVVVGYGSQKKETLTGAVTVVSDKMLTNKGSMSSPVQALQGQVPGVIITRSSGAPGDESWGMKLRGAVSANSTDPLVIIDGVEYESVNELRLLNSADIESINFLKDASAAIYGSKAANGVIVIELKKNPSGDLRVTYNGSMEIEAPDLSSYDLCNAAEKLEVEQALGMFNDPGADFESQRMMIKMYNQRQSAVKSGINTDWISKPLRLGVGNKHSLSVELGDKALQAIVDLSYQNIKGVMKGSDRTNISGAISLLYRHQNFLFRNQLTITSNEAHDSKYGTFDEYTKLNPYYTPYDQYGHLTDNIVPSLDPGNSVTVNAWYEDIEFEANPLYNAQLNTLLQDKYVDITNNFELQWFVMTGLKATARFGLTEQRSRSDEFYPSDHLKFASYSTDRLTEKGSYDLENGEQHSLSGKFDVQYNKNFLSVHDIFVNAGFDLSRKQSSTNLQQAEGFPSDKMTDIIFARQYLKDAKPKGTEETVLSVGKLFL